MPTTLQTFFLLCRESIFQYSQEYNFHKKTFLLSLLQKFALDGLRTLVLGIRDLTEQEFSDWKAAHHLAAIAMENREEKLDSVYNQIEKDLVLLGATAIEDKLQDGVPRTIANLRNSGIKIWVLTGDKQETAINIGYSCQLLSDDLVEEPFIVDGQTFEEVQSQLVQHRTKINGYLANLPTNLTSPSATRRIDAVSMMTLSDDASSYNQDLEANDKDSTGYPSFSLVISGQSLVHALRPDLELLFLGVAEHCNGTFFFHREIEGFLFLV